MKQYKIEFSNKGTIRWCNLQNKLHRLDGPAVEWSDGTKEWWVNGERHRIDGPAIEWSDGAKAWHVDGELHRLDGPAIEWRNGTKEWWVNGERHRIDGPAIELGNGVKEWWVDGVKEWWVDGVKYDEQTFNREFKITTSCMSGLCMWVSVSDEMPEEQDVNKAGCKYYHLKIKNFNNGIGFYANGVWRKDYVSVYDNEVTHWLKEF
jgi:hypothetical protein